jgi:hypothetical protein
MPAGLFSTSKCSSSKIRQGIMRAVIEARRSRIPNLELRNRPARAGWGLVGRGSPQVPQKNFHALPPLQTTQTPSRKFVIACAVIASPSLFFRRTSHW